MTNKWTHWRIIGMSLAGAASILMFGNFSVQAATLPASNAPPTNESGVVQVSTATQLEYIDSNASSYLGKTIDLMSNISLGGYSWIPLGNSSTPFSGTFNGQGYTVSDITETSGTINNLGFFGVVTGTVENFGVETTLTDSMNGGTSGGLVGTLDGGTILNAFSTGSLSGGGSNAGGLVGTMNSGIISASYSTASVSGGYAGGLIGVQNGGAVTNAYATGAVQTETTGYAGGLEADLNSGSTVTDAYAIGPVSVGSGGYAGGLFGFLYDATASGTYFSPATTGQNKSVGYLNGSASGTYASNALTDEATYSSSGWNFTNVWAIQTSENGGYPYLQQNLPLSLRSVSPPKPLPVPPTITPVVVTVGGQTFNVIGNLGYNTPIAILYGTDTGYQEERAALAAGASAVGEGINSSYLSAILSGSGVGLQQHVSATQQGQFAALYQKLKIIPTWTSSSVTVQQGVKALLQEGASTLAIENYLVQLDGFSWAAAQNQAQAGFPIGN